jgi:hypothetical protein
MSESERMLLTCAAALLDQGRILDRLSRPLTAAALIGLLSLPVLTPTPPGAVVAAAIVAAIAGLVQVYFAIRVAFDAALFNHLASTSGAPDFASMDAALARLGLAPHRRPERPADARVAGARRLLKFQTFAVVVQVVSILGGVVLTLL